MGLYLPKKSTSVDEVLKDVNGPKVFKMVFHRSVDKESITEAWTASYKKNCGSVCDANKSKIDAFNKAMSDMRNEQAIIVTTFKDKVDVDVQGRKPAKISIDGADFVRIVEKIWLGPFPPNEELKTGIMGGK